MYSVLAMVLLSVLFPGAAVGKEAWAVFAYIQDTGSAADNQVFYVISQKGKDDAINKARTACEARAKKEGAATYRCEIEGTCSEAGWSATASNLKSGGRVGTSCKQTTKEDAVNAAKNACGSGTCATIFSYEIKRQENRRLSNR